MLIRDIQILETINCLTEPGKFKATTCTGADCTALLPYLNAVVDEPVYQEQSATLQFVQGVIEYTLRKDQAVVARFKNTTELYECLEWLQELVNDTDDSKAEITPNYKSRKVLPALTIYNLLPRQNCGRCGEKTCMAFAAKLNLFETRIERCPLLFEGEFSHLREKLIAAFD